jgi:hypothetical protein
MIHFDRPVTFPRVSRKYEVEANDDLHERNT